jgi:hypothetical protein
MGVVKKTILGQTLCCCIYANGLYLAVANNGQESRKITQLLHPTLAA